MTIIIIRKQGGGKTTELVKRMASDETLTYVVATQTQAMVARETARHLGINLPENRFVPLIGLQDRKPRTRDEKFLVDEADVVLSILLGGKPVEAIALTGDVQ